MFCPPTPVVGVGTLTPSVSVVSCVSMMSAQSPDLGPGKLRLLNAVLVVVVAVRTLVMTVV